MLFASIVNAVMIWMVLKWLPDWDMSSYMKTVVHALVFVAKNISKFIVSIALIVVFVFVFTFREKFLKLAGLDHKTVFRFKLRDVFGQNKRPIEVQVYKVEELPSAQMWAANNVFLEMYLGYNEPMKTRVHNNAGTTCLLKESIQLNFDEDEEEEPLHVFVKNQKVMGSSNLGQLELSPAQVKEIEEQSKKTSQGAWEEARFQEYALMPRGKIFLRVNPIDDAEDGGKTVMC